MAYRITGLAPDQFAHLYSMSDADLAVRQVVRMTVVKKPDAPCRVTLADADIGEQVLLLNHEHLPVASPYRSAHAIFVRAGAAAAASFIDEVPEVLACRLLSLRGFDDAGMMQSAEVVDGAMLAPAILRAFADPQVAYLHAHNAGPGCYAARIDRA